MNKAFGKYLVMVLVVVIIGAVLYFYKYEHWQKDDSLVDGRTVSQELFSPPYLENVILTELPAQQASQFAENKGVVAEFLSVIDAPTTFKLADFPGVEFRILKVIKAAGGVPASSLNSCDPSFGEKFIFVEDIRHGAHPQGFCLPDDTHLFGDALRPAWVVVELEIVNNGSRDTSGIFMWLFSDKVVSSQSAPNSDKYGAEAFSSSKINLGFVIPSQEKEVRLIYGNYSVVNLRSAHTAEDILSQSRGGFVVDFDAGTIFEIPG